MLTALLVALWLFGVASTLYGSTLLYWAWRSPEDARAAWWHIVAGAGCLGAAVFIMSKV